MLVIFDCDGVLVDSEPRSNRGLQAALAAIGLDMAYEEVLETFMGRSWTSCLALVRQRLGHAPPASFTTDYMTRRDAALRDGTLAAVPGAPGAVAEIAAAHDVCVASSGDHDKMAFTLRAVGLWDVFAGRIFSATDVEHGKPAPDLFLHAAATRGHAPADCVVVEDAPAGVAGARAAGMRVLAYDAGLAGAERLSGAERVFDDMALLPELVGAPADDVAGSVGVAPG